MTFSGYKTYFFAAVTGGAAIVLFIQHVLPLGWLLASVGISLIAIGFRHALTTELSKLGERVGKAYLARGAGQVERR